jgi:hypothetical protein
MAVILDVIGDQLLSEVRRMRTWMMALFVMVATVSSTARDWWVMVLKINR